MLTFNQQFCQDKKDFGQFSQQFFFILAFLVDSMSSKSKLDKMEITSTL